MPSRHLVHQLSRRCCLRRAIFRRDILVLMDMAQEIRVQLRKIGEEISFDDFGTGYSSLSCLKLRRADDVIIDRAFITDVTTSRDRRKRETPME